MQIFYLWHALHQYNLSLCSVALFVFYLQQEPTTLLFKQEPHTNAHSSPQMTSLQTHNLAISAWYGRLNKGQANTQPFFIL